MIHGIQPGPLLIANNPSVISTIYAVMLFGAIVTLVIQYIGMRFFPKIVMIPHYYLYPLLLVLSFIGAYVSQNFFFNIWVMLAVAGISLIMDAFRVPYSPFILAFILGPLAEKNLRLSIMYSGGAVVELFTRPISALFLGIAIFSLIWPLVKGIKGRL